MCHLHKGCITVQMATQVMTDSNRFFSFTASARRRDDWISHLSLRLAALSQRVLNFSGLESVRSDPRTRFDSQLPEVFTIPTDGVLVFPAGWSAF
ncbi:hypothetical protein ADUPG1_003937, partial [Aduncisulcus paluster]